MQELQLSFKCPVYIRWSDLDALGHVNNAIFLTYFEESRLQYFTKMGWDWQHDGLIVARNEINYRRPLLGDDAPIMSLACTRLGTSSFDIAYKLHTKDGNLVADGLTTLVCYDYATKTPKAIGEPARTKLIESQKD
jgi:acyl-CoA thioester hydrolase